MGRTLATCTGPDVHHIRNGLEPDHSGAMDELDDEAMLPFSDESSGSAESSGSDEDQEMDGTLMPYWPILVGGRAWCDTSLFD